MNDLNNNINLEVMFGIRAREVQERLHKQGVYKPQAETERQERLYPNIVALIVNQLIILVK